ncbi:MAG: SDR family NAD(P)-dependent oxidoreductase [Myxococcota bacterium]
MDKHEAWRGKRVLVTGAGGFIGSHLVEALVASGASVTALVRYNGRGDVGMLAEIPKESRGAVRTVLGDVRDPFQVRTLVTGQDAVFHLAALIGIPFSYEAPQTYVEVNVQGTLNVLEAARVAGGVRVIHTSTSEVYGTAQFTPITEEHPLQGQSPYSASKIGADAMADAYGRSFGVPVVTVRPFNTFGPRQSTRAVLPTIITQALRGDVVRLGSTSPVRDMTYVSDTVRGFLMCGASDACVGKVTNLGVGSGRTVGEMVETVGAVLGKRLKVELGEERVRPEKSEVLKLISDNSRARERAGWSPLVSFEDGVRRLVEDIRTHPHRHTVEGYHV